MLSAPKAVMTMVSSAAVPEILTEAIELSPVGAGPRGSSRSGCTERRPQYRQAPQRSWTAATKVRIVATKTCWFFSVIRTIQGRYGGDTSRGCASQNDRSDAARNRQQGNCWALEAFFQSGRLATEPAMIRSFPAGLAAGIIAAALLSAAPPTAAENVTNDDQVLHQAPKPPPLNLTDQQRD